MSGYLLDTNVVSETRKRRMNSGVERFLTSQAPSKLYLSVLTIGELQKGAAIKRQTDPRMADAIETWIRSTQASFSDRLLPIDLAVACRWGDVAAGRTRPVIDTLIAATALIHGMTLVTRNTADVQGVGLDIIDPFETGDPS